MSFRRVTTTGIIRGTDIPPRITTTARPRAATIAAGTGLRRELPELRPRTVFPARLRLGQLARKTIRRDLFSLTRSDGLEAGGFLHGFPYSRRDEIVDVRGATDTGDAIRGHSDLSLDFARWERAERALKLRESDQQLLGDWHAHPRSRVGSPSDTDLRAWLTALDYISEQQRRAQPVYVGVIFTAHRDWGSGEWWSTPEAHAWAVSRDRRGRPFCDRLAIQGRA